MVSLFLRNEEWPCGEEKWKGESVRCRKDEEENKQLGTEWGKISNGRRQKSREGQEKVQRNSKVLFWTRIGLFFGQHQSSPINYPPSGSRKQSVLPHWSAHPLLQISPTISRQSHHPPPQDELLCVRNQFPPYLLVCILWCELHCQHYKAASPARTEQCGSILQQSWALNTPEGHLRNAIVFQLVRCVVIPYYQHSDQILDACYQQRLKAKSTPVLCRIPAGVVWISHECLLPVYSYQRSAIQWRTKEEVMCFFCLYIKRHVKYVVHA